VAEFFNLLLKSGNVIPHSFKSSRDFSLKRPLFWIAIFNLLISIWKLVPEQMFSILHKKNRLCSDGFLLFFSHFRPQLINSSLDEMMMMD
jgi:hypothetical protein